MQTRTLNLRKCRNFRIWNRKGSKSWLNSWEKWSTSTINWWISCMKTPNLRDSTLSDWWSIVIKKVTSMLCSRQWERGRACSASSVSIRRVRKQLESTYQITWDKGQKPRGRNSSSSEFGLVYLLPYKVDGMNMNKIIKNFQESLTKNKLKV